MKELNIKSALLRAAMLCQAKDDVRFYLNGVHVNGKHIEATNGHIAVRMTMDSDKGESLIVSIKSKIPAAAVNTTLLINDEPIAKHYDLLGSLCAVSVIEIIVGNYPSIDKVIKDETKPVDYVGINTEYISLFPKMFKERFSTAKMEFNGIMEAIKMTSTSPIINEEYGSPIFIIMPARI
tara:strand:- start:331 stop:870 length:540 start_codon:yes stop_codon:yes gene_type:complete